MNYSITGIAYLSYFLALGYFLYRLFQYWKRERNVISKLWIYFIVFFEFFLLPKVIAGIFFAANQEILKFTIYSGGFFQALAFSIMAYLIVFLKFPKISPWFGFFSVLAVAFAVAILTLQIPFSPFLQADKTINWGLPSGSLVFVIAIIRAFLFLITFLPIAIINFIQFKDSSDHYAKMKALGLGVTIAVAAVVAVMDFVFLSVFNLGAIWRDAATIFSSLVLFATLFFTKKSVSRQKISYGEEL